MEIEHTLQENFPLAYGDLEAGSTYAADVDPDDVRLMTDYGDLVSLRGGSQFRKGSPWMDYARFRAVRAKVVIED